MKSLYSSPIRVYLCLGSLAIIGILVGLHLPISLFPNSTKPTVSIEISYGGATAEEFLNSYGLEIENQLNSLSTNSLKVENIEADYGDFDVQYKAEFPWGASNKEALKEVQVLINSITSRMPREIRDSAEVWTWSRSGGFLAISFYSNTRSLTELYKLIEPILSPELAKVPDADNASIYNPEQKDVFLEIIPEALAAYHIFPRDIENAVREALSSQNGGSIQMGPKKFLIKMPKTVLTIADFKKILIPRPNGQKVALGEVARVDLRNPKNGGRSFKTSGIPSIILFATPKPDGNVKKMAEDILAIVEKNKNKFPDDINYKILVDPSEFIRNAVNNVSHEVLLGAFLAVLILYIFIGSLKNVATAAIEIPMSMVLAFILMHLSKMNLNIISLGGLALSAGMNVDASVVVMENIFRHLEKARKNLSPKERLETVLRAVQEVRFPVIASTIASLVVFLPLAFTSELSYAILGDLAKTVVFSHGFSAIVALVLVPTVRLQLLKKEKNFYIQSPIEKQLNWLENTYATLLEKFLKRPRLQAQIYIAVAVSLTLLVFFVVPKLPKEIIGIPDTDWIMLGVNTKGNSNIKQMESVAEEKEAFFLKNFSDKILYTFTQTNQPNSTMIMARLKDKREMLTVWKAAESLFANSAAYTYFINPWNPAELPIPNPPHLRLVVRGGTIEDRAESTKTLKELLQEKQIFPRVWTDPDISSEENILFEPYQEQIALLNQSSTHFSPQDIADLARVATTGRSIGKVTLENKIHNIDIGYPEDRVASAEDLGAMPIGIDDKLIPIKALGKISLQAAPPQIYRENNREIFIISAKQKKGDENKIPAALLEVENLLKTWKGKQDVSAAIEDANKDQNTAIQQLGIAILLSIALIFITMVIQFGDVVSALLVLVSVPLGIIGVILSLFLFQSTVSLNSALGIILLNGLAVANSIILVDFMKKLVEEGMGIEKAAIEAAKTRLRPILITSLTTLLGMMPIALGFGDGGRILQPLGIAVSGGLWISMALTLFLVPALQVSYLKWKSRILPSPEIVPEFTHSLLKEGFFSKHISRDQTPATEEQEEENDNKIQPHSYFTYPKNPTDTLQ